MLCAEVHFEQSRFCAKQSNSDELERVRRGISERTIKGWKESISYAPCGRRAYEPCFAPEFNFCKDDFTQSNPILTNWSGFGAVYHTKLKGTGIKPVPFSWCGRRDLNPYSVNHTPLKRARLPVPPLPHIKHLYFITRRRSPRRDV